MIRISEAESRVMQLLWQRSPLSAEEIIAALAADNDWQDSTVKTLLNRLLQKAAVSATRDGRRYLYAPVLEREHWQTTESRGLLDRAFGGQLAPMLSHFVRHESLSAKDLDALRSLVEAIDREAGKDAEP